MNIQGEHEFSVPPLSLPESGPGRTWRDLDLDELNRYDAIQLFVQRARAARPDFEITEGNRSGYRQHLPPAGWVTAGDRTCRCPDENTLARGTADTPLPQSGHSKRRSAQSAATAPDDARRDRMELRSPPSPKNKRCSSKSQFLRAASHSKRLRQSAATGTTCRRDLHADQQ